MYLRLPFWQQTLSWTSASLESTCIFCPCVNMFLINKESHLNHCSCLSWWAVIDVRVDILGWQLARRLWWATPTWVKSFWCGSLTKHLALHYSNISTLFRSVPLLLTIHQPPFPTHCFISRFSWKTFKHAMQRSSLLAFMVYERIFSYPSQVWNKKHLEILW
jgi:hypothetical protein